MSVRKATVDGDRGAVGRLRALLMGPAVACRRRMDLAMRRLGRDARGAIAVEFALIAPVLLLMLLGAVEVTRAVSIDSRLAAIGSAIADLVARDQLDEKDYPRGLSAEDITAIYDIAELMMSPFDASRLRISIVPVRASMSDNGRVKPVVYSKIEDRPTYNGGAVYARCAAYPLPDNFLKEGDTLIVVEASYEFSPLFGSSIIGSRTWTEKAFASPRGGCVEIKARSETEKTCIKTCNS